MYLGHLAASGQISQFFRKAGNANLYSKPPSFRVSWPSRICYQQQPACLLWIGMGACEKGGPERSRRTAESSRIRPAQRDVLNFTSRSISRICGQTNCQNKCDGLA
ncbi:hypothetical protein PM082_018956 [Marasmius tenuissimus]|nr:hypothetical protein PM082_018956 [Marasmius tenuissimus]